MTKSILDIKARIRTKLSIDKNMDEAADSLQWAVSGEGALGAEKERGREAAPLHNFTQRDYYTHANNFLIGISKIRNTRLIFISLNVY